jgi:hypothetical protein
VELLPTAPPPTVLLPARPRVPDASEVEVVLRLVDAVLVVVACSSLEALVRGCGPDQPWVAMRAEDVDDLRERWAAVAVLLDPGLLDPALQEQP